MLEQIDCAPYIEYKTVRNEEKRSEVEGIQILYVDLPKIVEKVYPVVDPKNDLNDPIIKQQFNILGEEQKLILATQMLITRYCIHRVLTHFKVYTQDVWMYRTSRDYYGEEVQTICLKPTVISQIEPVLETLRAKSAAEKLEAILKIEYGYLIPSVTNKKWFVKKVSQKDLEYSNAEHYTRCKTDIEESEEYRRAMSEFPYPRAVTVLNPSGSYKVIDGYHRLVSVEPEEEPLVIYCLRD